MWKRCSFFPPDVQGIVHREFVPPGQTVNQEFYFEVLRRLRENVRRKRPELWRSGDWFLHHDNAPAQISVCDPIFGLSGMDRRFPPTLFTGPSPLLFLFIPDNEKITERGRDLPPCRRWKQLRRRNSTSSSFSSSRDPSHSGKKYWTSVLPQMESILKGIKCFLFEM